MTVCKFFEQGNCRNGSNCRFEHPSSARPTSNAFGRTDSSTPKYGIKASLIKDDLTLDRPSWAFSAYGPGRDAPAQLIDGLPIEQSFEELRHMYQEAAGRGQGQQALNDMEGLHKTAQQNYQRILNDLDGAVNHILQAEHQHPNRLDICKQGSGSTSINATAGQDASNPFGAAAATSNPFGSSATTAPTRPNPFGGGSAFGQTSSMAGNSAFGAPSALGGTTSAFGQPSAMGGGGASAFGRPSGLGGATTSAFGAPSQLGTSSTGAFGAPSQLGNAGNNAFGSPSQLGATNNAFGAASQLGQRSNPFGAPAAPAAASGFGAPSQLGARPNPFGNAAASTTNAFGGSSQSPQPANPFGATNQAPTNAFGSSGQSAPTANPFGNPSTSNNAFGQNAASSNPFGQQSAMNSAPEVSMGTGFGSQPSAVSNPFGAATAASTAPTTASGKGPYPPDSTRQHPPMSQYATFNQGALSAWKGRPVTQKPIQEGSSETIMGFTTRDNKFVRIWNPTGPPIYYADTEPTLEQLRNGYGADDQKAWAKFEQTGRFEVGKMPAMAPQRVMCTWDN